MPKVYSIMDDCKVGGLYYNTKVNRIPNISCWDMPRAIQCR